MNLKSSAANYLECYKGLASTDFHIRQQSNRWLLEFIETPQAWLVARQLLIEESAQERFLGGQLLNSKAVSSIHTLGLEQLKELKAEALQIMSSETRRLDQSNQVVYILARTVSLCWLWLARENNNLLLEELVNFMKQSIQEYSCGLIILRTIPEEYKKLFSVQVNNEALGYIMSKKILINQILHQILKIADRNTMAMILEIIENWAELEIGILEDVQIVSILLSLCQVSKDYFQNCAEILFSALPTSKKSSEQLKTLALIIGYILNNYGTLLASEQKSESLGHLLEELLRVYGKTLLNDPSNTIVNLLEIMIFVLKHKSLDTSRYGVTFWTEFYKQNQQIERAKQLNQSIYGRIYSIIQQKCMLNSPQNYLQVYQTSNMSIESQLMQTVQAGPQGMMMFKEYRQFAAQLVQSIYQFFIAQYGTQLGNNMYFTPIFQYIKTPINFPNRNQRIELALFLTSSIMIIFKEEGKQCLNKILAFIPTALGNDISVRKQALRLMVSCSRQISSNLKLLEHLSLYALSNISEPSLSIYSTFVFVSFMDCLQEHNMVEFSAKLLNFYKSKILQTTEQDALIKFIEGYIEFIINFDSKQNMAVHLTNFLNQILLEVEESCANLITKSYAQKILNKISTILNTLQQHFTKFLAKTLQLFIFKIVNYSETILNSCFKIVYSERNCLGLICKIIRTVLKMKNSQPEASKLLDFMDGIARIFIQNPKQNVCLLETIGTLIEYLCQIKFQRLTDWLTANIHHMLDFTIQQIDIHSIAYSNPDYFKSFYCLCEKLSSNQPQCLINYSNREYLVNVCLEALRTVNETMMAKYLLLFIESFVSSKIMQHQLPIRLSIIISVLLESVPNINKIYFQLVIAILTQYEKATAQPNFEELLQKCKWLQQITKQDRKGISKKLHQSIKIKDNRKVKEILNLLHLLGHGKTREEVVQHLQRIYS